MIVYETKNYRLDRDYIGNFTLYNLKDSTSVYFQGDDTINWNIDFNEHSPQFFDRFCRDYEDLFE